MNTLSALLKKVAIIPIRFCQIITRLIRKPIRFCQIIARLIRKVSPTSKLTEIPNQKNEWQKVGYDLEKAIRQYKIK